MSRQTPYNFPQTVITLLRFHGFWPKDESRMTAAEILRTTVLFCMATSWLFVGSTIYLVRFYNTPSVDITDNLVVLFEGSFFVYMYCFYFAIIQKALDYFNDLENFENFGKPKNLDHFITQHNFTAKCLYAYCIFGIIICSTVSYFEGMSCEEKYYKGNEDVCGLVIPIWIPFIMNVTTKYLTIALETVGMLYTLLGGIVGTYFGICCMDIITLRIKHLKSVLENIATLPSTTQKETIKWCIKYHLHIIRLTDGFNNCFGHISAVHLTLSSVILGVLNHQMMKEMQLKAAIQLLGWLLTLFMLCNAGQNLINESSSVSTTLYFLNWYEYDLELKFYIKLMIMRSLKRLSITAGIFYSYSFEMLQMILRASYTYMTFMNHFNNLTN